MPVGIVNMHWAYISAIPKYTKAQYENKEETLLDELKAERIEGEVEE